MDSREFLDENLFFCHVGVRKALRFIFVGVLGIPVSAVLFGSFLPCTRTGILEAKSATVFIFAFNANTY